MVLALCYTMPRISYPLFRCGTILYNINKYNSPFYTYYSLRSWARHLYGLRPKPANLFLHFCCFHFISLWALEAKPVFRLKVGRAQQSFLLLFGRGPSHVIWGLTLLSHFYHLQLPLRSLLLEKKEI